MCFYCPSCHLQLACNFRVITALQEKLYNLPLARAKPNRLVIHLNTPYRLFRPFPRLEIRLSLSNFGSIHDAITPVLLAVTSERVFPQPIAGIPFREVANGALETSLPGRLLDVNFPANRREGA